MNGQQGSAGPAIGGGIACVHSGFFAVGTALGLATLTGAAAKIDPTPATRRWDLAENR